MRRLAKILMVSATCVAATSVGLTSGDAAPTASSTSVEYHACLNTATHALSNVVYRSAARRCAAHQVAV